MAHMVIEEVIKKITESLIRLDPQVIILFGSAAQNMMHEDSDLDILIVLNNDVVPNTYEDKLGLKMMVRNALGVISKQISVDLIVYTKPEYAELQKQNSSFYRELKTTGKVLYDKAS